MIEVPINDARWVPYFELDYNDYIPIAFYENLFSMVFPKTLSHQYHIIFPINDYRTKYTLYFNSKIFDGSDPHDPFLVYRNRRMLRSFTSLTDAIKYASENGDEVCVAVKLDKLIKIIGFK